MPLVGLGTFPAGAYASLARPGGNITGVESAFGGELYAKLVQLLYDAVPTTSRIAWLGHPDNWNSGAGGLTVRTGVEQFGLTVEPVFVDSPVTEATIRKAFASMAHSGFDALYVAPSVDVLVHHKLVAELAATAGLPAIAKRHQYSESGLLMTYGPSNAGTFRPGAWYVDRILKGADPAELPIEQPMRIDFIVNLKTAKALGIELPLKTLYFATEVIE